MLRACLAVLVLAPFHALAQPADLRAALDDVRKRHKAPAVAAGVVRDGRLLGVGVSGVRALVPEGEPVPATIEDRWPTGSCTKPMTRFMIGRLAERGLIDPKATLATLLPTIKMRPVYRDATLTQVLAHRAGIQPYTEIGPRITPILFELKGTPETQRAAFVAHVLQEPPVADPGTLFEYSNAGFCVAAVAAETRTGKAWEALVQEEVLATLGMTNSIAGREPDAARQPKGHLRGPDGYRVAPRAMAGLAAMAPAGGVKATPADFARFAAAYADLQAGRAVGGLSEATARLIVESGPGDQGDPGSPQMFFGGDGHYTAAFAIWPRLRLGIAVLSNAGESDDLCADAVEAIRVALADDAPAQGGGPRAIQVPQGNPPKSPRWGFVLAIEQDSWSIREIVEGSSAEKSGLLAGDEVVAINGTPLKDLSEGKRAEALRESTVTLGIQRDGKAIDVTLKR
ncbi:MAG: serine hydrolase [Phycisphaerales bacterium]